MYNISVKFIFQLAPNLVDGVEVQTLRGPVHYFQCSSRFLLLQVVPALVRRMFRVIVLLENKSRPNKTTPRWYSVPHQNVVVYFLIHDAIHFH